MKQRLKVGQWNYIDQQASIKQKLKFCSRIKINLVIPNSDKVIRLI